MSDETLHAALRPVSPSECALAITIPITRERFFADLAEPDDRDLIRHFRATKGLEKADPEFCWKVYQADEATFVQAICLEAARLGVRVCYDVQLQELPDLLNSFVVVTLVAHWKFVQVSSADIKDAREFIRALRSPRTAVQELIRKRFELLDPELLESTTSTLLDTPDIRGRIAHVINATAAEAEAGYMQTNAQTPISEILAEPVTDRLTRLEFEQAFPFAMSPARSVEFKEGMHTVPELVRAIPDEFSGLLDLTVCNSVIPAGSIRQLRPKCLVAANRYPAELKARMYLYGLQINLLAKTAMPFVEVIKKVHTEKSAYQLGGKKRWNLFEKFFNSFRVVS